MVLLDRTIYSNSMLERDINHEVCFLLSQDITTLANKKQNPKVEHASVFIACPNNI